jgi:membrane fusion protein, multidrug efflux system
METMENNLPSATHQEKAKKMKKLRRWQIAISLLGVAIIVWGVIEVICLFLNYSQTETSNDAQIEQYVSPINLRASGYIDKIYFTEHQEVHKGDTLLVLDDREYKIRVMEAEAALKDAQAGATVINATLNTTQTTASVYDASIAEIEVRLAKLEKDRKRYENLVKRNAATPIQLEQIVTDYEATRKKLEATKRQKKAALSGVDEVSYRRMNTEAAIQRATAALEMARLNLSYTVVIAPCDGKLGRRSLEEGQFISAGQTIMPAANRSLSSFDKSVKSMRTGMRCWIFTKLPAELSVGTNEYLEPVAPDIEVTLPLNSLSLMASTVTNTSCPICRFSICVSL